MLPIDFSALRTLNIEFASFSSVVVLLVWRIAMDLSKLTAAVKKLETDFAALVASSTSQQPAIDALTDRVNAIDAQVVAATPAPTPAA